MLPILTLVKLVTKHSKPLILSSLILCLLSSSFFVNAAASQSAEVNLLTTPWKLVGNNGAVEKYQSVNPSVLQGKDTLRLTYNLHGVCLLGGDASALIFDQPAGGSWRFTSLSNYGKNCFDGNQTVDIPLSRFSGLNLAAPVGTFHVRFWNQGAYTIDITSATVSTALGTIPTPLPTAVPQATPTPIQSGQTPTSVPTAGPTSAPTATPSLSGYQAQYWNLPGTGSAPTIPTTTPTVSRNDNNINFAWSYSSPDARVSADHFAARWTKTQYFNAGTYRFTTVSDDGIRLWIDNQLLVDQWNDHSATTYIADKILAAGNHTLKVEYYENAGESVAKVSFTPAPLPTPIVPVAPSAGNWSIQSVSSMKETKDKICGQDSPTFIASWVDKAKELGANYIAVETPYENPACGNALTYTKTWVDTIRSRGLKVWHRHMPLAHEGIYDVTKTRGDYLNTISSYIKNNPSLFVAGDIFTPIPEPQNGGISGITGCASGVCQYDNAAHFNRWLRDAIDTSETAFQSIGLGGKMKIGYYGFDGFVAWGSNNPDWNGILEDATVAKMGNITIDHYPELINSTMKQGLDELQAKYPNTPIVIGEWGSAGTTDVQQQVLNSMGAAKRPGVVGFNYWHMGTGGNEALINSNFTNRPQFDEVQSFFKGTR